ncbi:MAG: hypothetical protein KGY80_01245 [Candidatus Thorarchaeota archaeon]|nr:hypothetical protein [Candidatus Thorarchaeota archaeon]
MADIERKIRRALEKNGIRCQSVYKLPDADNSERVLIAFDSKNNGKLSTKNVRSALNSMSIGQFSVPRDFQHLSAAFVHLEVELGARTEPDISKGAS